MDAIGYRGEIQRLLMRNQCVQDSDSQIDLLYSKK